MLRAKSSQGRQRPTPNTQQLRRLILTARRRQEHVADSTSPDHGETGRVPIRYLADDILRREQASFKDSLGMDVLGTPAEVLILRDDARRRLHSLTMPTVEARHDTTQVSISSSDLLKDIDAERGIIGTDHVCENIDNVRRSWAGTTNLTSGPVTKLAYGDLISRLQDGFKLEQLTEYLARRRNSADDVLDLNIDFTTTLFSRSSWKARGEEHGRQPIPPKTSQPTKAESLAGPFATRERRERNVTRKRVVIERILRECWSIKHRDNDPPLGEMDIRLQPTHLKLITNHSSSSMI